MIQGLMFQRQDWTPQRPTILKTNHVTENLDKEGELNEEEES